MSSGCCGGKSSKNGIDGEDGGDAQGCCRSSTNNHDHQHNHDNGGGGKCAKKYSTTIDDETKLKATKIVEELLSKKRTILDIVEELGSQLTNSDVDERMKAVVYLTEIMQRLPKEFLLKEEVSALLAFNTARLQDSILLLNATLKSLQYLISCDNFPPDAEGNLLLALFKEINVQSATQDDRYRFYQIVDTLFENRMEGIKSISMDFCLGFIQAMEGEKDPRCLLLVFDLFAKICKNLHFDPLVEDMFEVVACYFPIVFEPPPNDPYGITSEDLSKSLRRALTSHPKFAPLCAQLLEDQLREESIKTKREAFVLLDEALRTFPSIKGNASPFVESSTMFWDEIRKQVMSPKDDELEELALKCLESLVEMVAKCTDEEGRNSNLVVLLGQIFRDCEPFLSNPEMKLLHPTNRMLLTACKSTSPMVTHQLANRALPLFLEKYQSKGDEAKADYAKALLDWCRVLKDNDVGGGGESPLFTMQNSFKTLLLDDMLTATTSTTLLEYAFQIATCLLSVRRMDSSSDAYLSDDDCLKIANQSIDRDQNRRSASEFLRQLATTRFALIETRLLPILDEKIQHESTSFLSILASLLFDGRSAKLILSRITDHLTVIPDVGGNRAFDDASDALKLILEMNRESSNIEDEYEYRLKSDIFEEDDWKRICDGIRIGAEELAEMIGKQRSIEDIGGGQEEDEEKLWSMMGENGHSYWKLCRLAQDLVLVGGSFEPLIIDQLLQGIDCSNLRSIAPVQLLVYVERIIAGMSAQEIRNRFSSEILSIWPIDQPKCEEQKCASLRMAKITASVVNKLDAGSSLKSKLDNIVDQYESQANVDNIKAYAWLCKAVLLRNLQPWAEQMFTKITNTLAHSDQSMADRSIEALKIILNDDHESPILSRRTRAHISVLAKQRVLNRAVALLTSGFEKCQDSDRKRNYFQALHVVLMFAPKNAQCDSETDKLLPLLLNSIQSDDQRVLTSSLVSLKQLIENSGNAGSSQKLYPHIPILCSRLMELAKCKMSSMTLRSTALDCIGSLVDGGRIPMVVLNPWRDQVLKQLTSCLDDPKRMVRAKAVVARNQWFLMA